MNVKLNENTIKLIEECGFEQWEIGTILFILIEIDGKNSILKKDNNILSMYKTLEMKRLVTKIGEQWQLTWSGNELFKRIKEEPIKEEKPTIAAVAAVEEESLSAFCTRWLDLWKNDKKEYYKTDGRSLGASHRDVFIRFQTFMKEYSYLFKESSVPLSPYDVIYNTTQKYVNEMKKVGFAFCKNSDYFISKGVGNSKQSILAGEIENYINSYDANQATAKRTINKSL